MEGTAAPGELASIILHKKAEQTGGEAEGIVKLEA